MKMVEYRYWKIMDYEKVVAFLSENHRPEGYTTSEIADATGLGAGTVAFMLPRLYEQGVIAKYKCKTESTVRAKTWYALVSKLKEVQ